MRYDVFVTVWGKTFVRKFIDFSLASQLAPGNLPALSKRAKIYYHIYTDKASQSYFGSNLSNLSNYVEIKFYYFDEVPFGGGNLEQAMLNSDYKTVKHNVQRITANHMLSEVKNSAAILMDSDFIIADGSLARMHDLRQKGKRAVMVSLLRLNETTVSTTLQKNIDFYLNARNLVKLCFTHMHPILAAYFVGSAVSTNYPSQLNWWVGQSGHDPAEKVGFVTKCLFPHPLMVEPDLSGSASSAKYFSTMDYDYALRAVADDQAIHLSKNSDEILICKMSPEKYGTHSDGAVPLSRERMAQFVLNNTNIRHRIFFDQLIHFVADQNGDWDIVNQEASNFIEESYNIVDEIISQTSISDPMTLVYLKSFLGPIEDFISPQIHSRMFDMLPR